MALSKEPIVKKFFTNKIESSRDDWYEYLAHIARIFYSLDGQPYNREKLLAKFVELSSRSVTAQRDASNFRDEFGAYGTYLGIYHLEQRAGVWTIVMSEAAKHFLCGESPNVGAFCRAQLALFQYPNGAGAVLTAAGSLSVQGNVKNDTLREVESSIRLNPFRLICRIAVAEHELVKRKISDISIPYDILFLMVNDDRVNTEYAPSLSVLASVYREYNQNGAPADFDMSGLTNFKRNFHILEKTGLFIRDARFGLMVSQANQTVAYECIKVISNIETFFGEYEPLYANPDEDAIKKIIMGSSWGEYYDAAHLPKEILVALGAVLNEAPYKDAGDTMWQSDEQEPKTQDSEAKKNMPNRSPRTNKMHPLNQILYGAPGTGKTYSTAEYALAIVENRAVSNSRRTDGERKTLMERYHACVDEGRIVFTTFHQSYGYEEFIQGLRPEPNGEGISFVNKDGVFKSLSDRAMQDMQPNSNYIIIIDEINRGNISKIFGELITLIEDDKRAGELNALSVRLPSGEEFAVPNNLYIIGTMNTADKSISLIDVALRRRFVFVEREPQLELVDDTTLKQVLNNINGYLYSQLKSTDLLIGHSYFVGKNEEALVDIMNQSVIPLLYEYFYDDEQRIKAAINTALAGTSVSLTDVPFGRIRVK